MKGDFTRFTHTPAKHYTRVLKQQGRVDLDADWNEQAELQAAHDRTRAADLIGDAGLPKGTDGFGITYDGSDLQIAPGRLYVDGLLCILEGETPVAYTEQPDLIDPPPIEPADGRTDLVYLDVWERHVTALEDPDLREVALGGPDTTTRVRTVCQVKVVEDIGALECDDLASLLPAASDATLSSAANQAAAASDPCILPASGGYRGLENRLYRVEVHDDSDAAGGPTFKWSRDNGSVVFAVEDFEVTGDPQQVKVSRLGRDQVLALHVDDWVEVLDDATELAGQPGILAQITDLDEARRVLTLSKPVTGLDLDGHPRVRRWDQPSDAIAVTTGAAIALEDGVEITFEGATFRTGDFWAFAARTVTASVEELVDEPAQGIAHHFASLARVTWQISGGDGDGSFTALIDDCRDTFPTLTDICAEDVCFDNDNCQLVGATNVQEALDQLCEANDLRHHNKHLHGFGIVCGLQVNCGPDDIDDERRHITVRDGYAIDCEGNNLILEEDREIDLLTEIEGRVDDNGQSEFLDENGDGDVCLTLGLDDERNIVVNLEPYTPPANTLASWFEGSLLMDFYNECLKVWVDLVRNAFTPSPEDEGELVSSAQKNFTTFLNLLWQLVNPQYGRYIFLSPKEDTILRMCYLMLRGMLQSKTFCAMFENARPFPPYPFTNHGISTIFGKGLLGQSLGASLHTRMRLHPSGQFAYTMGTDEMIHIFDVEKEEMIAEVAVPGGTGIQVRDVAFLNDRGDQIVAIATLNGEDTIFVVGETDGVTITWRPVNMLCGLVLTTLAIIPSRENTVYAVGLGRGLYELTPDNVSITPTPIHAFNASGHLVVGRTTAFATAMTPNEDGSETEEGVYDQVVSFDVDSGNANVFFLTFNDFSLTGSDDIAVVLGSEERDQPDWLFVVADPFGDAQTKLLMRFEAFNVQGQASLVDLEEDTDIRLGHVPGSDYLMVAYEDCYRIRLVQMDKPSLVPDYVVPLQISPLSMAVSPDAKHVYALNTISNTITILPAEHLNPNVESELEPPPGSQAFLDALSAYTTAVFAAFLDLLGGFLQYLKDCFCDRFLVDCPTCDDDDVIYLGVASIRGGEVYKVCNFAKRKYVKSFPLMGRWLSIIPIVPIVKQAMERFCCAVLPDLFGRFDAPQEDAYQSRVKGNEVRGGATLFRTTNFSSMFGDFTNQFSLAREVSFDAVRTRAREAPKKTKRSEPYVRQKEVQGRSVRDVQKQLEKNDVKVVGVEAYDPKNTRANLQRVRKAPLRFTPGAEVTLYEENGVIRYIAAAEKAAPAKRDDEAVKELRRELNAQKTALAELETLKVELNEARAQLSRREVGTVAAPNAEMATKLDAMEAELKELRTFRSTVADFMKRSGA